jgi:type I restriction enzyme S subunit
VLYGSRRTYLRKVAVAEFDGVTANTTFVVETRNTEVLLQEFLPFVMTSESFHAFAIRESKGSVNPYVNWSDIARFEFDLPPLYEQKRLSDLLWAMERETVAARCLASATKAVLTTARAMFFGGDNNRVLASSMFDILIGRQRSPKHESGEYMTPYLRSANVTSHGIDLNDVKSMNFQPAEQIKYRLEPGDVLVSEGSASASAVGQPAVWNGELPGQVCFQNTLLRFRAIPNNTVPSFVAEWCEWAFESGEFLKAASGTNIHHIGSQGASAMKVRAASIEQQEKFCEEMRQIAATTVAAKQQCDSILALKSAILNSLWNG